MGTALAIVLGRKQRHQVALWAHEQEVRQAIEKDRTNAVFLPGAADSGVRCGHRQSERGVAGGGDCSERDAVAALPAIVSGDDAASEAQDAGGERDQRIGAGYAAANDRGDWLGHGEHRLRRGSAERAELCVGGGARRSDGDCDCVEG